jgi:hypothetical protein
MAAAASSIIVYNTTGADIDIDELGITIPSMDSSDITHFNQNQIWGANTLVDEVNTGNVGVVSNALSSPPELWAIESALDILQMGVNSYQVGLHKVLTPGIVTGRYYSAVQNDSAVIDNTITSNHLYATPVAFMGASFNRIGIQVTTPVSNGAIRLGIYLNNNGNPGDLALDAGYVTTDTIGEKEITIDFTSPMDWYWLCALPSTDVECETINASGISSGIMGVIDGQVADFANVAFGTLPSTFPSLEVAWENPPVVWGRTV